MPTTAEGVLEQARATGLNAKARDVLGAWLGGGTLTVTVRSTAGVPFGRCGMSLPVPDLNLDAACYTTWWVEAKQVIFDRQPALLINKHAAFTWTGLHGRNVLYDSDSKYVYNALRAFVKIMTGENVEAVGERSFDWSNVEAVDATVPPAYEPKTVVRSASLEGDGGASAAVGEKRRRAPSKHQREVDALKAQHGEEVDALKAQHAEDVAWLENKMNQMLNELLLVRRREVDALKAQHGEEVDALKAQHGEGVAWLENKMAQMLNELLLVRRA
jgi:hypothetical protein